MEGAGVQICRTVGTPALRNLDPYLVRRRRAHVVQVTLHNTACTPGWQDASMLPSCRAYMLDELKLPSKQAFAGFPDHPHRGFETCSIMLEGEMEHQDSVGNRGVIGPGGVQWMTAGRGIIHSEMPRVTDGILHGFQLWINLPKKDKMCKPRYQDYQGLVGHCCLPLYSLCMANHAIHVVARPKQAKDIPIASGGDGVSVRVMAGETFGVSGPIKMRNPGMLLDVRLSKGATITQAVPSDWNGFAYVYFGSGNISGTNAKEEHTLVFGPGDHMQATAQPGGELRFLLIAGRPIGEPIVQHGPFVMNTRDEITQAFVDYQNGMLQNPADNPWKDEI
eukprot:364100-Chlamydomonas_euryale.AAC.26